MCRVVFVVWSTEGLLLSNYLARNWQCSQRTEVTAASSHNAKHNAVKCVTTSSFEY